MPKHKSICSLVAAAFLCMAVLFPPVAANADSPGGLTLAITPSVTSASLGENISFSYVITSTCNTTVNSLVLTDDKFGTISLPATSIASGGTLSVSVVHAVVLADFPGPFASNATVTGISADNATFNAGATSSVTLNPLASSLTVAMSADRPTASIGDNITYTYTIANTGQAALNVLALSDSRLGAVSLGSTSLAAGSSLTATKTYTVLPTDLPGPLTGNVTATATSSTGTAVTATSSNVTVTLNPLNSSLTVVISANMQTASVGDNISYTYTIANTGQAALSGLSLADSRLGSVTLGSTTLAAGSSLTSTKTYTVLSTDLPGPLTSSATATAVSAGGVNLTAKSATVKIALIANNDDDDDNSDNRTKADHLRDRGVPGKGIGHAPGLQKPFNPNSHGSGHESDNRTGSYDDDNNDNGHGNGNGKGNGHGNENGHGKNK
jgi:uncharacterized repeat protein (TIGR01451 family)